MTIQELINAINNAYETIETRIEQVKKTYDEKGITWNRISFEDVYLEDILEDALIPILPSLIEDFSRLPQTTLWKSYKVYIATLCEIAKRGINGGILKTVDDYIGTFDRNHHYSLIKRALEFEKIPIINKAKKYEETIIYEAGIPRGFRKKCLAFFSTYWKWLHNYDQNIRYAFLRDFLNIQPIDEVYILDNNDYTKLINLRDEFSSFSEKVIKTCEKLDQVFSAIDQYQDSISEDNLYEVSDRISQELGFDILTVIRTDAIKQYIIEYSKKVSFSKFEHLLETLPNGEYIELPNAKKKRKSEYTYSSYMGGKHYIRGNAYEVSFPIHLSADDFFSIKRNTPIMIGNSVVYTSRDDIFVERDGSTRPYRTFYSHGYGYLNVYYERVTPASFIYIDGQLLPNEESFSKRVFIGKYWDHEERHYKLAIVIAELKFADKSYQMHSVKLLCNNEPIYSSSVNRNGSFVIRDVLRPLPDNCKDVLKFEFTVGDKSVCSWTLDVRDMYIWGKQSGMRVEESIDIGSWIGSRELIVFSRDIISSSNIAFSHLYDECGYHVYKGVFDKDMDCLKIGVLSIPIVEPQTPYLRLMSEPSIISDKICIENASSFALSIANYTDETDCVLRIEHDSCSVSYNVRNLDGVEIDDVVSLFPNKGLTRHNITGDWIVSLFNKTKCISTITVTIVPEIFVSPEKVMYASDEIVEVIVQSSCDCFEIEGAYTNKKRVCIGKAGLSYIDGKFCAKPIEGSVYIDKCDISKQISVVPDVWDTFYIDNQKKAKRISDKSTNNSNDLNGGLYIVTTKTIELNIGINNNSFARRLIPGRNYFELKKLLKNALLKNRVELSIGTSKREFFLIYNPKISFEGYKLEDRAVSFAFSYEGPVHTAATIRVYSGENLVSNINMTIEFYKTIFDVAIDKALFKSSIVTIEAKLGRQDSIQLFSGNVELVNETRNIKGLFKSTSPILDLLEWTTDDEKRINLHNSIISILEAGGNDA